MTAVTDLEYITKQFGIFLGKLEDCGIVRNYSVEVWFNSPIVGPTVLYNPNFSQKFQTLVHAIDDITSTVSYLAPSDGQDPCLSLQDPNVLAQPSRDSMLATASIAMAVNPAPTFSDSSQQTSLPSKSTDEISAKPAARKILKKRLGTFSSKNDKLKLRKLKKRSLQSHGSPRQKDEPKPGPAGFTCSHCGLSFSLLVLYNAHLRKEHKNVTKLVPGAKCDVCGQKFLSVRALENHCEAVHGSSDVQEPEVLQEVQVENVADIAVEPLPEPTSNFGDVDWDSFADLLDEGIFSFSGDQAQDENDNSKIYGLRDRNKIKPPKAASKNVEGDLGFDGTLQNGFLEQLDVGEDDEPVPPPEVEKHPCEFCGECFASKRFLEAHEKKCVLPSTVGKMQPFFSCLSCGLAFRTILAFRTHDCSAPNAGVDGSLPALIADRELFDEDILSHLPKCIYGWNIGVMDGKRKFYCSLCREECRSHTRMAYHLSRCRGGPFKCELCEEERNSRPELDAHKMKAHKRRPAFFCDECSASYERKSSLLKHKQAHHEHEPVVLFRCGDCSLSFEKKVCLTKHRMQVHKEKAAFTCDECGTNFSTKSAMRMHVKTYHASKEVVKRFKCSECDRRFLRKEHLVNHRKIHGGGKPLSCDICGKVFATREKLAEHSNRHKCGSNLLCFVCGELFLLNGDLVKHMKEAHPKMSTKSSNWKYALTELRTGHTAANDVLSTAVTVADIGLTVADMTAEIARGAPAPSSDESSEEDDPSASRTVLLYRVGADGTATLV